VLRSALGGGPGDSRRRKESARTIHVETVLIAKPVDEHRLLSSHPEDNDQAQTDKPRNPDKPVRCQEEHRYVQQEERRVHGVTHQCIRPVSHQGVILLYLQRGGKVAAQCAVYPKEECQRRECQQGSQKSQSRRKIQRRPAQKSRCPIKRTYSDVREQGEHLIANEDAQPDRILPALGHNRSVASLARSTIVLDPHDREQCKDSYQQVVTE